MKNVLIVEDIDHAWAETTLQSLRKENWAPILRTDYKEALRDLENRDFHAVVVDFSLPSKDIKDSGFTLLIDKIRDQQLVLLGVHSGSSSPEFALKSGAEALLRKPVAPSTLQDLLESALIRRDTRLQLPSCFISYAHQDERFARKLRQDLESHGVECWFAPEDLEIGAMTRQAIHQAIAERERLLLILSRHSVRSEWVRDEVEHALAIEHKQKRIVLFPIRLDDAVLQSDEDWPATVRNTRNIGNFCAWRNRSGYKNALKRLIRDLKGAKP